MLNLEQCIRAHRYIQKHLNIFTREHFNLERLKVTRIMKQYNLSEYKTLLANLNLLKNENLSSFSDSVVQEISYNSKEVIPGTLFICKGSSFKEDYLIEAIERGAIGYVSEVAYVSAAAIPNLIVSDVRVAMPELADFFFNSPSKQLKIVAVGGTKGKTTTTHFIKAIIDGYLKNQGKQESGLISSIKVFDGLSVYPASNTTPEAIPLQRYLANAVKAGLEYLVLEVSSQALKYNRVDCIHFDVGIFLNISNDHISPIEHEDFEDYFHSKMKMFEQTDLAVINLDSDEINRVLEISGQSQKVVTYSKKSLEADFVGHEIKNNRLETNFKIQGPNFDEMFKLAIPGGFNVDNALAAVTATSSMGISHTYAKEVLAEVKVPGRMEMWESNDGLLTVIVDYAHNKLSYESLYPALRTEYPDFHIVSVFGARGGKALNRRKELVDIVGQYADEAILTMIHPDNEKLADINQTLAENLEPYKIPYQTIENRGEAIREAIGAVKGKTLVVITGRGHEDNQKIQGKYYKTPTDIEYVQEYLKEYNARTSLK